jgi:two-component system OmpR family response regulator
MNKELKSILCIDDDPGILMLTKACLKKVGKFEVTCCSSGHEGIEKAKEIKPDLIILDMMMPGMDGKTTLKVLQATPELDNIPVVFMTARAQPAEVEDYIKSGAAAVIRKPFEAMELSAQIRAIWEDFYKQ